MAANRCRLGLPGQLKALVTRLSTGPSQMCMSRWVGPRSTVAPDRVQQFWMWLIEYCLKGVPNGHGRLEWSAARTL
jgi:hypothetical protein